jgi:hypothetical protein
MRDWVILAVCVLASPLLGVSWTLVPEILLIIAAVQIIGIALQRWGARR